MEIFEAGKPIGTLTVEEKGLFWELYCKVTQQPQCLRRIYAQEGWKVEYLGIPDKNGLLRGKLPKNRMPRGIAAALASQAPRGQWLPWRGELDGVQVELAYIRRTEEGIDLALSPEETIKFPAWEEVVNIESILDREMVVLSLDGEGRLPAKDIEIGGTTDETMDCSAPDFELPDEPGACGCVGGTGDKEQGWQAHCHDL